MNKKQLIVAWVMGILISFFLLQCLADVMWTDSPWIFNVQYAIFTSLPVLIIGSLLIYTLRDREK